ncbi:hypothetical protein D0T12_28380 [Actinomadura spongiicola]|uniref:Uncharacterized protein n=1 Tax=Actinomadura spongiicola TaxID=2303421 RepID=A0A372G9X4_9ACTN|nr:hypothetical protein [Actinomadura spongiicola]RFS82160.1 hypothetical protein D0T12_28380 [Actinomadura spongiicola]
MSARVPASAPVHTAPSGGPPDGRRPGRRASFGLAATLLAVPVAVMLLNPRLAVVLYVAEFAVMLLMLLTAVYAPYPVCERAFRLLRWMTGQPEPAPPTVPSPRPAPREPRS